MIARVFEKDSETISRACHTVAVGSCAGKGEGDGIDQGDFNSSDRGVTAQHTDTQDAGL